VLLTTDLLRAADLCISILDIRTGAFGIVCEMSFLVSLIGRCIN
jgi:hypothetical protein